jgi:hypothetical protein
VVFSGVLQTLVSVGGIVQYYSLLRKAEFTKIIEKYHSSDTGSHNRLDLMQSLVPPHYVYNGYAYKSYHPIISPATMVIRSASGGVYVIILLRPVSVKYQ